MKLNFLVHSLAFHLIRIPEEDLHQQEAQKEVDLDQLLDQLVHLEELLPEYINVKNVIQAIMLLEKEMQ